MTSPYNLRPNPKPSQKIIENSGDNDNEHTELHTHTLSEENSIIDDNSRTLTANSPTPSQTPLTDTSDDEPPFHGFDPITDVEAGRHNLQQFANATGIHATSYSRPSPEPVTMATETPPIIAQEREAAAFDQSQAAYQYRSVSPSPQQTPDFLSQIQYMLQSLETNLNTKVNILETNLKTEIKTHYEILDNKIEALTNSQTKLQTELNTIQETQQQQSIEIKQIESKLTTQINESSYNLKINLKADLSAHKTEVNDTIQSQHKAISDGLNTTLNASLNGLKAQLNESHETQQKQLENTLKQNTQQLRNTLEPIIINNQSKIEYNRTVVEELKQTLSDHSNKIESLQDGKPNALTPNIYVTCGSSTNLDSNLPKFTGRAHNPREFLIKLRKYYDKSLMRQNPQTDIKEHLIDVIEMSLEGSASRWFSLIKDDIKTWETFEDIFLARFWNPQVQRGIKQRLENERYRPGGKLNRSEYFIERVITLKSMTPSLTDEEIVTLLSEHFSELIQDARVVQNANTIAAFESLLQREDIKDGNRRIRQNNFSPPHNNTTPNKPNEPRRYYNNHQNNNRDYRDNVNPNAYQPRHERNYPNNNNKTHFTNPPYNRQNPQHWPPLQPNRYPPNQNTPPARYHDRNEPRYPTNEQRQVCTTIVERTDMPNKPSASPSRGDKHLNG